MRILQLVPDLRYTGVNKQVAIVSLVLPRKRCEVRIGVLSGEGHAQEGSMRAFLQQRGVPVDVLGKPRRFDPLALWNLRRLVQSFRPDLIHVWSASCLRAVTLAAGRSTPVIATNVLSPLGKRAPSWRERWLLKRATRIVTRGEAEANRYLKAGARLSRIISIPPVIPVLPFSEGAENPLILPGEGKTRLALCAGGMEPHKGFRNAIWTLDILNILFENLHLLLVGDGADRPNLERFAQGIQLRGRTHFLGACASIQPFLDRAEMVWAPSVGDCGLSITLEAMAAGKPIIASNVPRLREVIRDGETGFLIPAGDKVALGRRTCELLRNPDLARRMGEAGRRQVAGFTPSRFVGRLAEIYTDSAAAGAPTPAR